MTNFQNYDDHGYSDQQVEEFKKLMPNPANETDKTYETYETEGVMVRVPSKSLERVPTGAIARTSYQ